MDVGLKNLAMENFDTTGSFEHCIRLSDGTREISKYGNGIVILRMSVLTRNMPEHSGVKFKPQFFFQVAQQQVFAVKSEWKIYVCDHCTAFIILFK